MSDRRDDEFDEVDVAAAIDEELDADDAPALPAWLESRVVTVGDRDFQIEEPTLDIVLRIVNWIGHLGMRGERIATRMLARALGGARDKPAPDLRAILFGILSGLTVEDLYTLGAAVLQFEERKEGEKWLKEHGLRLSPLIRALFLNVYQSEDLQESLADFFGGMEAVTSLDILEKLNV